MTIVSGTRLGPYEIIAPIGAGGMGEVWRGRDTRLDRSVAIKILPAALANDAQFKSRFEREARAISQLNHPHICTLYDVGDSYLVMELLEGESLADRIAKGPMPLEQVLRYGAQIADALSKAHREGIVHRDLKPGNIMITKSGAKLLDFGLAKSSSAMIDGDGATQHKPLTQEGTLLGTFQYMAPEQLDGLEADPRTDIFGLGTVLYEMATGRRAFDGKTKTSLIAAIVSSDPAPMSKIQPLMPPAFEHVVAKCLAKDRDDRWQSAHDIAEELRWIAGAGSQAGVAAPLILRRKSRERIGWAAAVILALIAGAIASRRLSHEVRPSYRFTVPMIDTAYKNGQQPRISPDGKTLYFRATNNATAKFQLFRRRLDELKAVPIDGTEDFASYLPSPDGKTVLVFFTGAVIKRVHVDGGPLETIIEGGPGIGSVSADGTILFGGDQGVRRLAANHKMEPVTVLDKAAGESGHNLPWFMPDGKHFLFLGTTRDLQRGTIRYVLSGSELGSKEITRIGDISSRAEYAVGHLFFVRDGTLLAQPFDPIKFKFTGEAVPVADGVSYNARAGTVNFSVATDGTIVYQPFQPPHRLTMVSGDGRILGVIGSSMSFVGNRLSVFPDGSRAVTTVLDRRAGSASQWIVALDRETATRLTFSPASEINPIVAPDGSRVFFSSDAQSPFDIYEAPVDGSLPPKLRLAAPNVQFAGDISPDGRFLVYWSNQNQIATRQDLWILPLAEGAKPYPFLATPAIESEAAFSPDGKWIAYISDITGVSQIYVRPFPGPGSARSISTRGGRSPRFSRDGRKIFFASREGAQMMRAEFRPDGSSTEPVMAFELRDQIVAFQPMTGDRFLMLLQNEVDAAPPVRVIVGWRPPQ